MSPKRGARKFARIWDKNPPPDFPREVSTIPKGDTGFETDKDTEMGGQKANVLLFLFFCRFFSIPGGMDRPALSLGLGFGRINFAGLSPSVTARNFLDWHIRKIYGFRRKFTEI